MPVAGDDWYQRRRDDAEGRFFRTVADQGPRSGEGSSTRQGVYLLSAGGRLLAYSPGPVEAHDMRATLLRGLAAWRSLPDEERRPAAVRVADAGAPDPRYARALPPGGLVLNVYTRALQRSPAAASCDALGAVPDEPARDRLWLTEAEWRSLMPSDVRAGDTFPVPGRIAERILRFHLVDNTRGEPGMWRREHIRTSHLTLSVEETSDARLRLRLDGVALLATDAHVARAGSGYDVRLLGHIVYDRRSSVIARFDVVAVGDHWTRGDRGRRQVLGVAFELARGGSRADHLPPHGARHMYEYFGGQRVP